VLDVNAVVKDLAPMLRQTLGSDRRFDVRLAYYPARVVADRGQVEQVIINLVANARDATSTNGVVTVDAEAIEITDSDLRSANAVELEPGRFMRLTVRDDGIGMSPEVAVRAFEPFFTTKGVGQGTGLGLSMVYGIVQQSGGFIRIDTAPGAGTAISVHLPLTDTPAAEDQKVPVAARGNGERILVVEDETVVRSLARRALEHLGYVVYQAPNGAAALEFLASSPNEINLVLTDIVMPNMNGRQLADHVSARFPGLPVVFTSGYSGDQIMQRGLRLDGVSFVPKPFTLTALAEAIRTKLYERHGHQK
jgi:CheY-like chemotaxis protein